MKPSIITVFVISNIFSSNANNKIDSILAGTTVSIGPYYSSVSVGNLTEKYLELDPTDVKASKNALELIKIFRRMFEVGLFTIPPLDPFISHNLKPLIIQPNTFVSGEVLLKSLTVTGAKHFNLKKIEFRMKTGRIDFEINFPELHFDVDFRTDLYLGGLIPLSLKGELRGQIDELQVSGALQTEVRIRKGRGPNVIFQVSGATTNIRATDIKVALLNGGNLDNDLLQSIYAGEDNSSLPLWITSTKNLVMKHALNTFMALANNVLTGLSVAQVNALLLPEDKE